MSNKENTPNKIPQKINYFKVNKSEFFNLWLVLLKGFVNLRPNERLVLAKLLEYHNHYSGKLTDDDEINLLLFSTSTRKKIINELDMKDVDFNNILTRLRKLNIIKDNSIDKNLIPTTVTDFNNFKLIFDVTIKR